MKESNDQRLNGDSRLDNLFRERLADHRTDPSENTWKMISRKLLYRELLHFNLTNLPRLAWITGTAVVILGGAAIWLAVRSGGPATPVPPGKQEIASQTPAPSVPDKNIPEMPGKPSEVHATAPGISPSHNTNQPPILSKQNVTTSRAFITAADPKKTVSRETTSVAVPGSSGKNSSGQVIPVQTTNVPVAPVQASAAPATSEPRLLASISPVSPVGGSVKTKKEEVVQPSRVYGEDPFHKEKKGKARRETSTNGQLGPMVPQHFSLGVSFTPDVTFYNTTSSYSRWGSWGGFHFLYHFGRFYAGPEVRIGYNYDVGLYNLHYKSNDSIGYYNRVIGYETANGQISYTTAQQTIYDSIRHMTGSESPQVYTYFQIPLRIGVNLVRTKYLFLSLEADPVVSFLVSSKGNYSNPAIPETGRVLYSEEVSPQRTDINWQLWTGLNLEYLITKKWSLFLRPYYVFYLTNTVKENGMPYSWPRSAGITVGFSYGFGFKNQKP
jgi:hypothetical protein